MDVWLVSRGYDHELEGVFVSKEAAMRAYPSREWEACRENAWLSECQRNDFLVLESEEVQH